MSIWKMTTEDGRVVAVRSATRKALRASVPPILHVCSESRAIGLKHYALSFSALEDPRSNDTLLARIYFNFDRNSLYFEADWNEGVSGAWCCTKDFRKMIKPRDLQLVKAVGFDLNSKICSVRSYLSYMPSFAG